MSNKIEFETPENIQVAYEPAGLGTRFVAWVIDNIVLFCLLVVIFFILICAGVITEEGVDRATRPLRNEDGSPRQFTPDEQPEILMYFVGIFTLIRGLGSFFYMGASELFLRGQTIGKRQLKIRVVRLDGFSLSPLSIFVRSLFRIIDELSPLWIVPLLSQKSQRLGDMVAGTVVVVDKPRSISPLRQLLSQRTAAEARFTFEAPLLQRARPEDFQAIERVLERWNTLDGSRREALLEQIVPALAVRLATEVPAREDRLEYVKDLLAAEFRRQHRGLG